MNKEVHNAERLENPSTGRRTILTIVIVVVLALLLTLLVLFSSGLLKTDNISFNPFDNNEEIVIDDEAEELEESSELAAETVQYMKVSLPMLLGSSYGIDGEEVGCDVLHWVDRYVEVTSMPLNATYRELFAFDTELFGGARPG